MGGPPAPDLIALLAVVFVGFTLQFFELSAVLPALLRLSPMVVRGYLWQLVSYPFVGFGPASLWFLLEMLILYWFGKDIFRRLGRRRFWSLLLWSSLGAAVAAVAVYLVGELADMGAATPFLLMQGQRMLLTILVAAFATLYGDGTILLFFVLPVKARWFLGLEILFAFFGYLNLKDLPGFIGICAAVAITYSSLTPGGLLPALRRLRFEIQRRLLERRLARMRRDRRFDVIDGGDGPDRDRWVH